MANLVLLPTAPQTVLTHAISIEAAAYAAYAPETSEAYKSKMRSLFQNLKNKSNPGLRLRIFAGEIAPDRFVKMSLEELKSKERREEDKQIQKENMDKAMVAQEEKSISSSLTCGKCQQKKVSYSQAQTRSADEPMTVSEMRELEDAGARLTLGRRFASVRCVDIGGSSRERARVVGTA